MPRPEKQRMVHSPPLFNSFKPTGVARNKLVPIMLSLDEYEAVRLADYHGLDHAEAAEMMEISRSTFTRLIDKARLKVSKFLVDGAELSIEGGNIHFRGNIIRCMDCEHMFNTSFERAFTVCPSCGSTRLVDIAGGYGHGRCCSEKGTGHGHGRGHGGRNH
ncbi:MAG: DUF134 domain-containing protein [Spirochaetales bacterium]|nr:DUF134 domain-containing protein [Spirochaetales bacterium]